MFMDIDNVEMIFFSMSKLPAEIKDWYMDEQYQVNKLGLKFTLKPLQKLARDSILNKKESKYDSQEPHSKRGP